VKTRVAVVGAGVAGISAAYHLRDAATVTLFEAAARPGGHAYTVQVEEDGETIGLDTAFIVFNRTSYPNLMKFFAELGVATKEQPGQFSFFDRDAGATYVSEDFELPEEEMRRRYPEDFVDLWRQARRFRDESLRHFMRREADMPLGEYLERHGYNDTFRYGFLVLVSTAVWSVPAEVIWEMPASTVIAFYAAHGMEGLGGRTAPWATVDGGSINYVRKAMERIELSGSKVRTGTPVLGVRDNGDAVAIRTGDGVEHFDYVVLAAHADDSMAMLSNPTARQRGLEVVNYHPTRATLHTDRSLMPADRVDWRSWNYGRIQGGGRRHSWVTYNLNALHGLSCGTDYFVTLDSPCPIREESIIEDISYRHPVFNMDVRRLQSEIHAINDEDSRVKFAGSYIHSRQTGPDTIGSHEAAFASGSTAAQAIIRQARQAKLLA
jgi:predicted NAD/FAD-binding protein